MNSFVALLALAVQKRDISVKASLERDVRLVRCEDGRLEIALERSAPKTLVNDLSRKLGQWTGRPWMVVVSAEQGQPTLKSQADARQVALETGVRGHPLVQTVLQRWPGAEITAVRGSKDAPPEPAPGDGLAPADEEGSDREAPDQEGFGDNWVRDDD
jgi:DNA polymerase-3 subunit gamma/tau